MYLTQVQLMNRQEFRVDTYRPVYEAAFFGGKFLRAFGPPLDYATGNWRALGGNPDVAPFLIDPVKPPHPNEAGWKDTVVAYPGEVMRIVVKRQQHRHGVVRNIGTLHDPAVSECDAAFQELFPTISLDPSAVSLDPL
jgi:hypothetical protein